MKKNFLFFSNYCSYSQKLLNMIKTNNIKEYFIVVCVDNPQYKLPSFVDRFPLLFTEDQNIIIDEAIEETIVKMIHGKTKQKEVEALELMNIAGISHEFSFIDDGEEELALNKNYIYIENMPVQTTELQNENNEVRTKFNEKMFDEYKNQRANDDLLLQNISKN